MNSAAENPSSKNLHDMPTIKNIENVQCDERDIIIFSVGYATDADGKPILPRIWVQKD